MFVELDPDEQRLQKAKLLYPALVFGILGVQLIGCLIMRWLDSYSRRVFFREEKDFDRCVTDFELQDQLGIKDAITSVSQESDSANTPLLADLIIRSCH